MSPLQLFTKNSSIYILGTFLVRITGFISIPIFTSYLDPVSFGVIGILALISLLLQPIFTFGIGASVGINFFQSDHPQNRNRVIWTCFYIFLMSGFILIFSGIFLRDLITMTLLIPEKYGYLVTVSFITIFFNIITQPFTMQCQFENRAFFFAIVSAISSVIVLSSSCILIIGYNFDLSGIIFGQFIGSFFSFLVFFSRSFFKSYSAYSIKIAKDLLKIGIPMLPSFIFSFLLLHFNRYLLQVIEGLDSLGIFTIGFTIGSTFAIITNGIATAWYPFFNSYVDKQKEAQVIFGKITFYYILICGFLCSVYFFISNPLVVLLTTEPFYKSSQVIGLVALSYFLETLFGMFNPNLYFYKKVYLVSVFRLLSCIVGLSASYVLIKSYGIIGCALGLLIGHLTLVITIIIWEKIDLTLKMKVQYDWKKIISFIVLTLSIIFILKNEFISIFISTWVNLFIFTLIYLILTLVYLDNNERAFLKKFLRLNT